MEKQTAVEFILEHIGVWLPILHKEGCEVEQIFTEAKALEKQQIVEAYQAGRMNMSAEINSSDEYISPEQYFESTYKTNL